MEINDFIAVFADLFDETEASDINVDTLFQDLDEWSSLLVMSVIALAKTSFSKTITSKEIRHCNTVNDLYNLIMSK